MMSAVAQIPTCIWRFMRYPPQWLYALGLGRIIGSIILLLTTKGRRSGKRRVTPLQYERLGDHYYIAAARGMKTDWVRNIMADPNVELRVGSKRLQAQGEIVCDPSKIADFLAIRLRNRPRFVGAILRMEGFPSEPSHAQLEAYAANRVMVILVPK